LARGDDSSEKQCGEQCDDLPGCNGFAWSSVDGDCWLKNHTCDLSSPCTWDQEDWADWNWFFNCPEAEMPECVGWRQTADCTSDGTREPQNDRGCITKVESEQSGFCDCGNRTLAKDCGSVSWSTCLEACTGERRVEDEGTQGTEPIHSVEGYRTFGPGFRPCSGEGESLARGDDSSEKQCGEQCDDLPGCNGFAWSSVDGDCWLKNHTCDLSSPCTWDQEDWADWNWFFNCPEAEMPECVGWRQTADCTSDGTREPQNDRGCITKVESEQSGFCDCGNRTLAKDCGSVSWSTCLEACTGERLASTTRYYVSEAGNPHRFKISTSPQKCCGWTDTFSFDAFDSAQPGTTRYYVSEADNPHRFKVSTSPQCCGWTDTFSFHAYDSAQPGTTRYGWTETFSFHAIRNPSTPNTYAGIPLYGEDGVHPCTGTGSLDGVEERIGCCERAVHADGSHWPCPSGYGNCVSDINDYRWQEFYNMELDPRPWHSFVHRNCDQSRFLGALCISPFCSTGYINMCNPNFRDGLPNYEILWNFHDLRGLNLEHGYAQRDVDLTPLFLNPWSIHDPGYAFGICIDRLEMARRNSALFWASFPILGLSLFLLWYCRPPPLQQNSIRRPCSRTQSALAAELNQFWASGMRAASGPSPEDEFIRDSLKSGVAVSNEALEIAGVPPHSPRTPDGRRDFVLSPEFVSSPEDGVAGNENALTGKRDGAKETLGEVYVPRPLIHTGSFCAAILGTGFLYVLLEIGHFWGWRLDFDGNGLMTFFDMTIIAALIVAVSLLICGVLSYRWQPTAAVRRAGKISGSETLSFDELMALKSFVRTWPCGCPCWQSLYLHILFFLIGCSGGYILSFVVYYSVPKGDVEWERFYGSPAFATFTLFAFLCMCTLATGCLPCVFETWTARAISLLNKRLWPTITRCALSSRLSKKTSHQDRQQRWSAQCLVAILFSRAKESVMGEQFAALKTKAKKDEAAKKDKIQKYYDEAADTPKWRELKKLKDEKTSLNQLDFLPPALVSWLYGSTLSLSGLPFIREKALRPTFRRIVERLCPVLLPIYIERVTEISGGAEVCQGPIKTSERSRLKAEDKSKALMGDETAEMDASTLSLLPAGVPGSKVSALEESLREHNRRLDPMCNFRRPDWMLLCIVLAFAALLGWLILLVYSFAAENGASIYNFFEGDGEGDGPQGAEGPGIVWYSFTTLFVLLMLGLLMVIFWRRSAPRPVEDYAWLIKDFLRCSITCNTPDEILEQVERFRAKPGMLIEIKNGFHHAHNNPDSGYRDLKLILRVEFGDVTIPSESWCGRDKTFKNVSMICELQLLHRYWLKNKKETTSLFFKFLSEVAKNPVLYKMCVTTFTDNSEIARPQSPREFSGSPCERSEEIRRRSKIQRKLEAPAHEK